MAAEGLVLARHIIAPAGMASLGGGPAAEVARGGGGGAAGNRNAAVFRPLARNQDGLDLLGQGAHRSKARIHALVEDRHLVLIGNLVGLVGVLLANLVSGIVDADHIAADSDHKRIVLGVIQGIGLAAHGNTGCGGDGGLGTNGARAAGGSALGRIALHIIIVVLHGPGSGVQLEVQLQHQGAVPGDVAGQHIARIGTIKDVLAILPIRLIRSRHISHGIRSPSAGICCGGSGGIGAAVIILEIELHNIGSVGIGGKLAVEIDILGRHVKVLGPGTGAAAICIPAVEGIAVPAGLRSQGDGGLKGIGHRIAALRAVHIVGHVVAVTDIVDGGLIAADSDGDIVGIAVVSKALDGPGLVRHGDGGAKIRLAGGIVRQRVRGTLLHMVDHIAVAVGIPVGGIAEIACGAGGDGDTVTGSSTIAAGPAQEGVALPPGVHQGNGQILHRVAGGVGHTRRQSAALEVIGDAVRDALPLGVKHALAHGVRPDAVAGGVGSTPAIGLGVPAVKLVARRGGEAVVLHGESAVLGNGVAGHGTRAAVGVIGHGDFRHTDSVHIHRCESDVAGGQGHIAAGDVDGAFAIHPVAELLTGGGSDAHRGLDHSLGVVLVALTVGHSAGSVTYMIQHLIARGRDHQRIEGHIRGNGGVHGIQGQIAPGILGAPAHEGLCGAVVHRLRHLQAVVRQVGVYRRAVGDGPGGRRVRTGDKSEHHTGIGLGGPAGEKGHVAVGHGAGGEVVLFIALSGGVPAGEGVLHAVHRLLGGPLDVAGGNLVRQALAEHHIANGGNSRRSALGVEGQGPAVAAVQEAVVVSAALVRGDIEVGTAGTVFDIGEPGNVLGAQIAAVVVTLGVGEVLHIGHTIIGIGGPRLAGQLLKPVPHGPLVVLFNGHQRHRAAAGGQHIRGNHQLLRHPVAVGNIRIPAAESEVEGGVG